MVSISCVAHGLNTDIKLHQPPMEYNWNEDLLYVIGVYSTFYILTK